MTSERAARANRRNAQASTGPRTAGGKARSGQNARKHGLSAADPNPEVEVETERLAVLIAGEHASDVGILQAARAMAEAQSQLQRVKAFKLSLLRTGIILQVHEGEPDDLPDVVIPLDLFLQLEALERYERRALSRRKAAARGFNDLVRRAAQMMAESDAGCANQFAADH